MFPLLHSHAISSEVSVACVLRDGVRAHLMPRLTAGAREELAKLSPLLDDVLLSEEDDRRTSPLSGPENVLRTGPIYKMLMKTTGALCVRSPPLSGKTARRRGFNSSLGSLFKKRFSARRTSC